MYKFSLCLDIFVKCYNIDVKDMGTLIDRHPSRVRHWCKDALPGRKVMTDLLAYMENIMNERGQREFEFYSEVVRENIEIDSITLCGPSEDYAEQIKTLINNLKKQIIGKEVAGDTAIIHYNMKDEMNAKHIVSFSGWGMTDDIYEGQAYIIGGRIRSNFCLTGVEVKVIDDQCREEIHESDTVNDKTYDLSRIDERILINELTKGHKTIEIWAGNNEGRYKVYAKKFKVLASENTLRFSGWKMNGEIYEGQKYAIDGHVESSSTITLINIRVKNELGDIEIDEYAEPGTRMYRLGYMDSTVLIGKLGPGKNFLKYGEPIIMVVTESTSKNLM